MRQITVLAMRSCGMAGLALWAFSHGVAPNARAEDSPAPPNAAGAPPPPSPPNPKHLLDTALARSPSAVPDLQLKIFPLEGPLTPATSDPRDFGGVWESTTTPLTDGLTNYHTVDGTPFPFTDVAFGYVAYRMAMDRSGENLGDSTIFCRPPAFLRSLTGDVGGMRILQTEDRLILLGRWDHRTIYLNRGHPEHLTPTYMGDSVGHWEGDTLVVDTVGFNDKVPLQGDAPRSTQLHVVERMHRTEAGFQVLTTVDDPVFYTKPFTVSRTYSWRSDLGRQRESVCEDNIRYKVVNGIVVDDVGEK